MVSLKSVSYFVDALLLLYTLTPSEEAFLRGIRQPILRQHSLASTPQTHEGCFVRGEISLFLFLSYVNLHTHGETSIYSKNTPPCVHQHHMGSAFGFIAEHTSVNCLRVCLLVSDSVVDESVGRMCGRVSVSPQRPTLNHYTSPSPSLSAAFSAGETACCFDSSFTSPAQLIGVHMDASNSTSPPSTFHCLSFRSSSITLSLTVRWEFAHAVRRKPVKGKHTHTLAEDVRCLSLIQL